VTPNAAEAAALGGAEAVLRDWEALAVAETRGADGARLHEPGRPPRRLPAPAAGGDPCGAGDCFAAAVTVALARGAAPADAVAAAVAAASAFVDAGGAGALALEAPPGPPRLVATGGCFDLLHAGHVQMLAAARAQGDRLVVLLNSDASVRRLKGPGRPVVGEEDRAAVLRGLASVDEVVVFDEDEPSAALARVRPDVWVKAADYAGVELPEAGVLGELGARTVLVPLFPGRSTTRLIEEVASYGR